MVCPDREHKLCSVSYLFLPGRKNLTGKILSLK